MIYLSYTVRCVFCITIEDFFFEGFPLILFIFKRFKGMNSSYSRGLLFVLIYTYCTIQVKGKIGDWMKG